MHQVVMTADGRNTVVYIGTEKSAQRRCEKLRKADADQGVIYAVIAAKVTSTDHKTSRITNHN